MVLNEQIESGTTANLCLLTSHTWEKIPGQLCS